MASFREALAAAAALPVEPPLDHTHEIMEHSESKGATRLIVLMMACAMDVGVSAVSLPEIVHATRLSARTVLKHLRELIGRGSVRMVGDRYSLVMSAMKTRSWS